MRDVPTTVPINLPLPTGRYDDDFGHGVTIGASSSTRVDGVWVWLSRHGEMSPDEARGYENMNPIPNGAGAVFYRPANVMPAEAAPPPADPAPEVQPVPEGGQ